MGDNNLAWRLISCRAHFEISANWMVKVIESQPLFFGSPPDCCWILTGVRAKLVVSSKTRCNTEIHPQSHPNAFADCPLSSPRIRSGLGQRRHLTATRALSPARLRKNLIDPSVSTTPSYPPARTHPSQPTLRSHPRQTSHDSPDRADVVPALPSSCTRPRPRHRNGGSGCRCMSRGSTK